MFQKIYTRLPMYDEEAVQPMRDELIAYGFQEMRNPEEVDRALTESKGTALVVINSVCGCAAGSARPGVGAALQNKNIPDHLFTSFAGQDGDAVEWIRQTYLHEFAPSSPSLALLQDGKVICMMERKDIEGRRPQEIAANLKAAFDQHCSRTGPSVPAEDFANITHAVACGSTIPRAR